MFKGCLITICVVVGLFIIGVIGSMWYVESVYDGEDPYQFVKSDLTELDPNIVKVSPEVIDSLKEFVYQKHKEFYIDAYTPREYIDVIMLEDTLYNYKLRQKKDKRTTRFNFIWF